MNVFFGIAILIQAVRLSESACSFPSAFQNTWLTSTRGTWTVNSSTIINFPAQVEVAGQALFNMDCEAIITGFYVLKSQETVTPFGGSTPAHVYTCLYLEQQSSYNYIYSLLTEKFAVTTTVIERVTIRAVGATVIASSICSDTAYTTAGERVHVALLNGSESLGKADCPSSLQGHFTYLGTSCNSTSVDVCTDTKQLVFNTTACTQNTIYSQNGTLDCVYHNTIGSYTYVTLYNEDSSVDNSAYYAFSCLVVSEAGVYTYVSVKPTECEAHQVSTTTPTGGYVTVFQETAACTTTTTTTEDLTYLYVIIGLIVLLIIITIIVLLICCIKCRKKQKDVESADDESDKVSEDGNSRDEDSKPDEDESKQEMGDEQQRTKTDDDKQSVDSGFIPGKDETKHKKKRKRRRRRRKKRERHGEEGEEEEEEEEEVDDESSSDRSGGEDDSKDDANITLKDGQRKRIDGEKEMNDEGEETNKKTGGKYIVPPGLLSKVLVTREMEEKNREKATRRKSKARGVRLFASKKSKKLGVSDENQDDEMNDTDMEDIDRGRFVQPVAPYMEQYHSKKDIEKKLDDAHYWDLPEDDNIVMQLDQIEEELAKEEQKEIEKMEVDVEVAGIKNGNLTNEEGDNKVTNDIPEQADNAKNREETHGSRSSSRADSPESKKVRNADSSCDLESGVFDLEDECLPEGYIRNENGHIVRMADGKVYTKGTFKRHMKKARLKRLFNIPRLNRNKKGRPTGGVKDDTYGPERPINDSDEQVDTEKKEVEEGRTSGNVQRSSDERRRTSESRRRSKTVAFSDAVGHFDKEGNFIEKEEQPRIDSSTVNRRKLKNRLFRKKKRKTEDLPPLFNGYSGNGQVIKVLGVDNDKPRELSNLVKVYGQPGTITSTAPRSTLPPIGLTRSSTTTFDRNQLQNFREGLSKDQEILERANTIGSNPLASQRLGVRRISVEELSSEGGSSGNEDTQNVELGSEDEFFLVGGPSQSQNEPLFTRVRPPPESDLAQSLKSNHDQRHAIPWSILNPPPRRPHTDGDGLAKSLDAPRSADMLKREMDDKRLRELLEELYRDKKYFDHVIDTTDPQEEPDIDDRYLAEHGRDFLLDRADFWEDRGPLPTRPPRTSLGMRLSRLRTMTDSGRVSMTSTNTCTPTAMELPNQMPLRQENTFS